MTTNPYLPPKARVDGESSAVRIPAPLPIRHAVKLSLGYLLISIMIGIILGASNELSIRTGPAIGIKLASVGVFTFLVFCIFKGRNWARWTFTGLTVTAVTRNIVHSVGDPNFWQIAFTALGVVVYCLTAYLLFCPESSAWFKNKKPPSRRSDSDEPFRLRTLALTVSLRVLALISVSVMCLFFYGSVEIFRRDMSLRRAAVGSVGAIVIAILAMRCVKWLWRKKRFWTDALSLSEVSTFCCVMLLWPTSIVVERSMSGVASDAIEIAFVVVAISVYVLVRRQGRPKVISPTKP